MQEHINQVKHNIDFHNCLCTNFPDKFFDWKITVLFYTALHLVRALYSKRGINIGRTHVEIEKNISPLKNSKGIKFSNHAWINYKALHKYSHTARYDGLTTQVVFDKLKKADYENAIKNLDQIKLYIKKMGISL